MTNNWPLQSDAARFYGVVGSIPAQLANVPFPFPVFFGAYHVRSCQIHKKCALSLARVFSSIAQTYDCGANPSDAARAKMQRDGVSQYDGTYALRNKVGGSTLSMHAYGCAIDFDAAHNPRGKQGRFKADSAIVKCFEAEGWIWGGHWHNDTCDPMHFQAAREGFA